MPISITEVLSEHRTLRLLGRRISDLTPRGSLGLPLDPGGPVGFALIRAWSRLGVLRVLDHPLMLAVYGDGERIAGTDPSDDDSERCWVMREDDLGLRLDLVSAPLRDLLGTRSRPDWT